MPFFSKILHLFKCIFTVISNLFLFCNYMGNVISASGSENSFLKILTDSRCSRYSLPEKSEEMSSILYQIINTNGLVYDILDLFGKTNVTEVSAKVGGNWLFTLETGF